MCLRKIMQRKELCIIIPVHKKEVSENEKLSIQNTIEKLKKYDIYFTSYSGKHMNTYKKFKNIKCRYFSKKYFDSIDGYNKLLLSPKFYKEFLAYKYMLIVQPDAYILGDREDLSKIINKGYDYWGAPWSMGYHLCRFHWGKDRNVFNRYPELKWLLLGKRRKYYVGNGGLSLRNVMKTYFLLLTKKIYAMSWDGNEDMFFAVHGSRNICGYKVAPIDEAIRFSQESDMERRIKEGLIPFGVHAWERYYPNLFTNI